MEEDKEKLFDKVREFLENPNDSLYKKLFENTKNVKKILEKVLPDDIKEDLNLEKIEKKENIPLENFGNLKEYSLFLYRIEVKDILMREIEKKYVLLILEHKYKSEILLSLIILEFMISLWKKKIKENKEKDKPLNLIIPVLIYNKKEREIPEKIVSRVYFDYLTYKV